MIKNKKKMNFRLKSHISNLRFPQCTCHRFGLLWVSLAHAMQPGLLMFYINLIFNVSDDEWHRKFFKPISRCGIESNANEFEHLGFCSFTSDSTHEKFETGLSSNIVHFLCHSHTQIINRFSTIHLLN